MDDGKQLITEWLNEYSALHENELQSFAAEHEHNHEIATAIFNLLLKGYENEYPKVDEKDPEYAQMLENVCTQLFCFYRSKEVQLIRFTLQFVPTLIHIYLSSVAQGNSKHYRCVETLLIGLYNIEVVDENGKPKVVSFRLPSLAQPSIYHDPSSLEPQFVTESALRRWEECDTKLVSWGPMAQVETINAQNRLKVMAALCFIFNRQLSVLSKLALKYTCIAASRTVTQGFRKKSNGAKTSSKLPNRIPVSSNFLLELVEGVYFAMFNEFYTLGFQAIQDIDRRAQYELFPDVMIVTSAVINSLKDNPSGRPCDGPMGISVALTPATTTVTISKSMITNASFRTKKLPDDIPIQAGQAVPTDPVDALTCITEEGEGGEANIQRGGARSSKQKLSSLIGKKTKESKDKTVTIGEKKTNVKEASKAIWNTLSGGGDVVDPQQKTNASDGLDANGSMKDEKMSMSSMQNSTDNNSDSRSQITSDSLDLETTPRFAAMQVSSV